MRSLVDILRKSFVAQSNNATSQIDDSVARRIMNRRVRTYRRNLLVASMVLGSCMFVGRMGAELLECVNPVQAPMKYRQNQVACDKYDALFTDAFRNTYNYVLAGHSDEKFSLQSDYFKQEVQKSGVPLQLAEMIMQINRRKAGLDTTYRDNRAEDVQVFDPFSGIASPRENLRQGLERLKICLDFTHDNKFSVYTDSHKTAYAVTLYYMAFKDADDYFDNQNWNNDLSRQVCEIVNTAMTWMGGSGDGGAMTSSLNMHGAEKYRDLYNAVCTTYTSPYSTGFDNVLEENTLETVSFVDGKRIVTRSYLRIGKGL